MLSYKLGVVMGKSKNKNNKSPKQNEIVIKFGDREVDIPGKSGKPIILQKEWHSTGAMKCPVRRNIKQQ